MDDIQVKRNDPRSRYELTVAGELAGFADYVPAGDAVRLVHTEIDPRHGGKGYGSKLAAAVVADIRAQGKTIVAQCDFMATYLKKEAQRAAT